MKKLLLDYRAKIAKATEDQIINNYVQKRYRFLGIDFWIRISPVEAIYSILYNSDDYLQNDQNSLLYLVQLENQFYPSTYKNFVIEDINNKFVIHQRKSFYGIFDYWKCLSIKFRDYDEAKYYITENFFTNPTTPKLYV